MTEMPEDRYISDRTIYGSGYDPEDIVEELKVQARKLVSDVYAEFYSPGHLKRILSGHFDHEIEVELAVKAILAERQAARLSLFENFMFDAVWDVLVETYGFASTSPVAKDNINFVLDQLEKLKEATKRS